MTIALSLRINKSRHLNFQNLYLSVSVMHDIMNTLFFFYLRLISDKSFSYVY
jgi:hypothetical protein